jgi:hypothetical protein
VTTTRTKGHVEPDLQSLCPWGTPERAYDEGGGCGGVMELNDGS